MGARHVYYMSDSTGVTVESLGRSVLAQFGDVTFDEKTMPFVNSPELAAAAVRDIAAARRAGQARPIVFYTFADEKLAAVVREADALMLDCLDIFIGPVAKELGIEPSHVSRNRLGGAHGRDYQRRIDAVNFTLNHDDGVSLRHYDRADIILLGVSRTSKTPTSLYLALHYGIFAANYPLVDEDLQSAALPECLVPHIDKLHGLTIAPQRLAHIRGERRPNSRYAELGKCREEVQAALRMFDENNIRYLDVTRRSVEELASKMLKNFNLQRHI